MNLNSNAQQNINCTTTWSSYETNSTVNNCSYSLYTGNVVLGNHTLCIQVNIEIK